MRPVDHASVPAARPRPRAHAGKTELPKEDTGLPKEQKDWTVLGFFNGNNDLESAVLQGVLDSERVGPNTHLNFVTQLARAPKDIAHPDGEKPDHVDGDWSGVRRYEARFTGEAAKPGKIGSKLVQTMPDYTDMGSTDSLADFLRWGVKNYPAKHYMIVINNHGAGFRGVSFDDVHDSHLEPQELRQVLDGVGKETGVKPDILLFDACEMGQTEVAYELRNTAKYLIGSEDLIGAAGMQYANVLAHAAFEDKLTPKELAREIVEDSAVDEADRLENGDDEAAGQFAAIDLSKMKDVREACDHLSDVLRRGGVPRTKLVEIVKRTKRFSGTFKPDKDYRDLGDFATNLLHSHHVKDEKVRAAAQQVLDAVEKAVIANQKEGEGQSHDHGLSIYLPTDGGKDPDHPRRHDPFGYSKLSMSKDGHWPKLLEHLHPKRVSA